MNSCLMRPAWPSGSSSIRVRASSSEVTFKRNTGPVCVWRIHHWSIFPARYSRGVAGTSLGKISFICSGVGGFVNWPIARIFVVGTTGKLRSGISLGVGRLVLDVTHMQLLSLKSDSRDSSCRLLAREFVCQVIGSRVGSIFICFSVRLNEKRVTAALMPPSIFFSFHPFAKIWSAILKLHAIRFTTREKADYVTTD